ncbi:hypothetical protein Tco_1295402 [Tanacetum coccineum]
MYDSWKSIMELYMINRKHRRMILESVKNGPLIWPSIEENGVNKQISFSKDYHEVVHWLSNHKVAKELWERIQLLMQGTSLTEQERECKLYDEFEKFSYKKGETLRDFYLRFSLLLNDMNIYNMKLEQFQGLLDCDELNTAKVALMVNLSHYGLDALAEFFYDHTAKQALGFQNPLYLKKAQQLEPKLYDGNVIKNTSAIVILDSKETQMLAEENFETRFVPQTELSAEQAFWSQNSMISPEPIISSRPTKVEVPKELPNVSMVNTSLKKLKHHLGDFNVVVKERTTTTAITEGSWGFEHTKACFRDEIILFVKAPKDLFNTFDQYLIDELSEVQNVFQQMEHVAEQYRLE